MKSRKILFSIIIISILFVNGCIDVDNDFKKLRNKIISQTGGRYDKEFEFSIGSVGLSLASSIVNITSHTNTEIDVEEILDEIDDVQIGVYKIIEKPLNKIDFSLLKLIDNHLNRVDWKYLVRSVDNGEAVAVYINCNSPEKLTDLLIVTMNDDEMVLAKVHGNLDKVIDIALKRQKFEF